MHWQARWRLQPHREGTRDQCGAIWQARHAPRSTCRKPGLQKAGKQGRLRDRGGTRSKCGAAWRSAYAPCYLCAMKHLENGRAPPARALRLDPGAMRPLDSLKTTPK